MKGIRLTSVLIVGAGPAGLTAAITLARNGIPCHVIERRPDLSALPRATLASTASMEIFRSWGLEEAIREASFDVRWGVRICTTLAEAGAGETLPVGVPSPEQAAMVSPTGPVAIAQDALEPVLLDHLRTLPDATVEFGAELVDLRGGPDGTRAVLRDGRVIEADYVIGADGAHSRVRNLLGIPMRGPDDLEHAVTALFRAPLWDIVGEHRYGLYSVPEPAPFGTFLPAGPDDRWLFGVRPGAQAPTAEELVAHIRAGAGVPSLDVQIERIGTFRFAAQIADRFRDGRILLVGDAAHRVTPRGGTGMNTAIRDGQDVGWKLSWVLNGWAGEELLDTYETERRPIVEHNLRRSADPNGSVRYADDALYVDLAGRIPHVWVPAGDDRVSTLDLLGPGLTLFSDADADVPRMEVPVAVRRLDAVAARALGILPGGSLLVRPDGLALQALEAWASARP